MAAGVALVAQQTQPATLEVLKAFFNCLLRTKLRSEVFP